MLLDSNTLFKIAKHTNKTIKIADFMVKAQNNLLLDNLLKLEDEATEIDLIFDFNKDVLATSKKIIDMHTLLSTVNEDGIVLHLKGENSLSEIFGDAYDHQNKTIKFPFMNLPLNKDIDRDELNDLITKASIGISYKEFKELHTSRNKTFKYNANELHTDDEKIEYLSSYANRERFEEPINRIKDLIQKNIEFRKSLTVDEKTILDEEITFVKAMPDAVAKNSLYISNQDGIKQWGVGFKRDYKDDVIALQKELKEHPYVEAIELDNDTDPRAFLTLLQEVKKLNLNLAGKVTLKSRKLGQHKANGLFYSAHNIIALDTSKPSAAIHEFVHSIDLLNEDIRFSKNRAIFANNMRNRVVLDDMLDEMILNYKEEDSQTVRKKMVEKWKKQGTTREVIARAGEVAYLFEKYDYNPESESFDEFCKRVSESQKINKAFDLRIENKIETFRKHKNMYFRLDTMDVNDVKELKEYYKSYFNFDHTMEFKKIFKTEIQERFDHKVVGVRTRFEKTALSFINSKTIKDVMNYNEKLKLIDPEKLIKKIFQNSVDLGRTQKAIPNELLADQCDAFKNLSDWAYEKNDYYIMSRIIEQSILMQNEGKKVNIKTNTKKQYDYDMLALYKHLENNPSETFIKKPADFSQELADKVFPIIERSIATTNQDERHDLTKEYNEIIFNTIGKVSLDLDKITTENPTFKELELAKDTTILLPTGKFLNDYGTHKRFKHGFQLLDKLKNESGNKIFNYFSKEDLAPLMVILSGQDSYKTMKTYGLNETNRYTDPKTINVLDIEPFLGVLNASGQLENFVNVSERMNYSIHNNIRQFKKEVYRSLSDADKRNIEYFVSDPSNFDDYSTNYSIGNSLGLDSYKVSITELKEKAIDLPEYQSIQDGIAIRKEGYNQYKSSEKIESEDPIASFVKTKKQEQVLQQAVKEEKKIENNGLKNLKPEASLKDQPIDPNPKIEEKSKRGRRKKIDPNQGFLF
jgi:hypothetical protein